MVRVQKVSVLKDLLSFHSEILDVLSRRQPHLVAEIKEGVILISGPFVCFAPEGPFDAYDIEIRVDPSFPTLEPSVREIGGRIERSIDWHMFNSDLCCLGIWPHWLWQTPEPDFEAFLTGPVHDFFLSQSHRERLGTWPFGERAHGFRGQAEAFLEIMEMPEHADAKAAIRLLSGRVLKGHHACPCGSGEKLRSCHLDHFSRLRESLDPTIILAMNRALKAYNKGLRSNSR